MTLSIIGVRYVIDTLLGNCTTVALSANLQDTQRNNTAVQNGSFVIHMKNSLRLLYLNDHYNYTFIGHVKLFQPAIKIET